MPNKQHILKKLEQLLPAKTFDGLYRQLKRAKKECKTPVTFWDFDGTIIDGDVTEGLVLISITQVLIDLGLSSCFSPGTFPELQKQLIQYNVNRAQGLALPLTIFNGLEVKIIHNVARQLFDDTYFQFYWKKCVQLLKYLNILGVKNYIVTASPTLFVEPVKYQLPITEVIGVEVKYNKNKYGENILTNKIIQLPYNLEKRKLIENFLLKNDDYLPILGVGNTINGDYPFLTFLAGEGAELLYVLDPANSSVEKQELVRNLGMEPFLVSEHVIEPPNSKYKLELVKIKTHGKNNTICMPEIPFNFYQMGEISARSLPI